MATLLEKDLTRETTIKVNEREIVITLTENQEISMKLKGMKSGAVSISIADLYSQLTGNAVAETKPSKSKNLGDVISLYDLRTRCNIKGFDYNIMSKLDGVLHELIEERGGNS